MTSGSRSTGLLLASTLLMFFAASGAHAITIPPVTVDDYTVSMQYRDALNTYPPDPGVSASSDQLGSLSLGVCCGVEVLGIPEPFLFTDWSTVPGRISGAGAQLTVYVEVAGPLNVYVPLVVTGTLEAGTMSAGAGSTSVAQIELASCLNTGCSIGSGQANSAECFNVIGPCDRTVTGTLLHFSVLSNTEFGLDFSDGVTIQNLSNTLATAFAEIDPVVSFDPSFTDAGNFQIFLSDGIGNGGGGGDTAPEPSTFALAVMALTAAAMLRRRVQASRR